MSSSSAGSSAAAARRRERRGLPTKVRMRHDNHFVEELTARSEPAVGRMIALSEIEPDPKQPRQAMGDLEEIVSSVREKGVLEPILIRRRPVDDGAERDGAGEESGETPSARSSGATYRIISGERRFRAALEAGLLEIPAIELDVSEEEALEIALIENLQRKDLTPFEEAEGYRALAELHGYTHEQIAKSVGKSRVAVTESLGILQMPPRVRSAVQALGIQTKSVLLEVLKADDEDEMIRLLERVSAYGLNRDDLRREVKRSSSRKKPARRKPYVFKFRAPDRRYSLSLSFRQAVVDEQDLIEALEQILVELREQSSASAQ
ncbi:MAG TPA: ParB/RepB/Spo0J family partition protein [Thermoanaerobaculia bacterium]|nr:ParB/RepB/Spo0J family partition protein [Thermoanaerobaculia bacterium]